MRPPPGFLRGHRALRPGAWPRLALLALLGGSLAGCFGTKKGNERCDDVAEYQASSSVPGVQAPEGLAAPNRASGYTVPPATGAELRGAACLSRPPPYFRPEPSTAPAPPAPPATLPAAPPGK